MQKYIVRSTHKNELDLYIRGVIFRWGTVSQCMRMLDKNIHILEITHKVINLHMFVKSLSC